MIQHIQLHKSCGGSQTHNSITIILLFSPDKIAIGRKLAGMCWSQARGRAGSLFYCYSSLFHLTRLLLDGIWLACSGHKLKVVLGHYSIDIIHLFYLTRLLLDGSWLACSGHRLKVVLGHNSIIFPPD